MLGKSFETKGGGGTIIDNSGKPEWLGKLRGGDQG